MRATLAFNELNNVNRNLLESRILIRNICEKSVALSKPASILIKRPRDECGREVLRIFFGV